MIGMITMMMMKEKVEFFFSLRNVKEIETHRERERDFNYYHSSGNKQIILLWPMLLLLLLFRNGICRVCVKSFFPNFFFCSDCKKIFANQKEPKKKKLLNTTLLCVNMCVCVAAKRNLELKKILKK